MKRVALLGDSQAQGLEPHLRSLLPEYGMELVWAEPRSGYTTARWMSEEFEGMPEDIDLAIVVLGGNDTATPSYPETLRSAAARIRQRAARVLWVGPSYTFDPDIAARHDATRAVQRKVLPKEGVVFKDPANWQTGPAGQHPSTNNPHFTRDAYELQAEAVALEADLATSRTGTILGLGVALTAGLGAWVAIRVRARRPLARTRRRK